MIRPDLAMIMENMLMSEGFARPRRPVVLWCFHFLDGLVSISLSMRVVFFSFLRPFGPRRPLSRIQSRVRSEPVHSEGHERINDERVPEHRRKP